MMKINNLSATIKNSPQLFIVILVLVIMVEIALGFYLFKGKITPPAPVSLPKVQEEYSGRLWLEPSNLSVGVGEIFQIKIMFNAAANPVNALDAILSYDPDLLQLLEEDIIPGTIFPFYPRKLIEPEKGRLVLTGVQLEKTREALIGDQTFALINFKALKKGSAQIEVAQGSTIIAAETSWNLLGEASGSQIEIK